jgi:hypothetical protein
MTSSSFIAYECLLDGHKTERGQKGNGDYSTTSKKRVVPEAAVRSGQQARSRSGQIAPDEPGGQRPGEPPGGEYLERKSYKEKDRLFYTIDV